MAHLYEMHASVEGNRRHGASVVVGHLHGTVPLAAIPIQQDPDAGPDNLIQGWDLLHVYCELEGDVTQQGGGDVASCPHPRPCPMEGPDQWGKYPQEWCSSLWQ